LDGLFDLVFVDGMHDYEQVKLDIQLSWRLIKDDGLFVFHDHNLSNVYRAIIEIFDPDKISSVEIISWCKKSNGRM